MANGHEKLTADSVSEFPCSWRRKAPTSLVIARFSRTGSVLSQEHLSAWLSKWAYAHNLSTFSHLQNSVLTLTARLTASTTAVAKLISNHQQEIRTALTGDDDNWRILFPGKRLMEEYTKTEGLGDPLILQNSLIKEMATSMDLVPEELRIVISRISNGEPLSTT